MSGEPPTLDYGDNRDIGYEAECRWSLTGRRYLRVAEHPRGQTFWGRLPRHGTSTVELHNNPRLKSPMLRLRPRRGLERGAKTWDILKRIPEEPDYPLGALRVLKRPPGERVYWELLDWEDQRAGIFRRLKERGWRAWRNLELPGQWIGQNFEFVVEGRAHGTFLRKRGFRRLQVRAHFSLTPREQRFGELFAGAMAVILIHSSVG